MRKGFTLIELVIVIAVIGLLVTVSLSLINPAGQFKKARDIKRKSDLLQIQAALELYRADQNSYPSALPGCGSSISINNIVYLRSRPCDPRNSGQYVYSYITTFSPPTTYSLIACLENVNDSDKDAINNNSYCTGGNFNWSYTLQNP